MSDLLTQSDARKLAHDKNWDGDYPNGMTNIAHAVPVGSWGGHEQGWTVSLVEAAGNYGGTVGMSAPAEMTEQEIHTELHWLARELADFYRHPGLPGTLREQRLANREDALSAELSNRRV